MEMDGAGQHAPHLIEERYNLEDALVAAGFLNSFIRHADVVKIATIAQIVNVIAPILTRGDEMLLQSIFHVFEMYTTRRRGTSLRTVVNGPGYSGATHGPVRTIDASAILDGNRLHVFATNRSLDEAAPLRIALADRKIGTVESAQILTGDDAKAENSFEEPARLQALDFAKVSVVGQEARAELPPLSVAAMSFDLA
jgi:alpha-N-arabinofuranosidase